MLSPQIQTLSRKSKPYEFFSRALTLLQTLLSNHPFLSLFTAVLFIHLIAVCLTRSPQVAVPLSLPKPVKTPPFAAGKCGLGRVFVYDLPAMFNKDLVEGCGDLDVKHWRCDAVSNGGYGPNVAGKVAGVMPEGLAPAWYGTSQFSLEILFHNWLLNHECRTMEPESAAAFYIPFYAALAVGKYMFFPDRIQERDMLCELLLEWVQDQPYWKRSNGSDHFIALGRITWDFRRLTDPEKLWGSSFLNMPAMQEVTRLTIERAPADSRDVGVPYPTGFHPGSLNDVVQWQNFVRNRNRTWLFSFIGATRGTIKNDFRGLLLSQCKNESSSCRLVDCSVTQCTNDTSATLKALLDSDFCLQPRGDSYTRRSIFDCMVAGSVPIFFWERTAYDQYQWFLPSERTSWSVFIDHNEVRNGKSIKQVLERYSREEVRRMREKVIEIIPKIVYAKPRPSEDLESFSDAFNVAIDGVLKRFEEEKELRNVHADSRGL